MINNIKRFFKQHSPRRFAGYVVFSLSAVFAGQSVEATTLQFNGGDGFVNGEKTVKASATMGEWFDLSQLKLTHSNAAYEFVAWYYDLGFTIPVTITADDKFYVAAEGELPLFAKWRVDSFSIVFNANQGNGTMSNEAMVANEEKNLTKCSYTRSGFNFKGWSRSPSAVVPTYSDGQAVTFGHIETRDEDGDVRLYAVWEKIPFEYTVMFLPGTYGIGSMPDIIMTEGVPRELPKSTYTPVTGYRFRCWRDGDGHEYLAGNKVQDLVVEGKGNSTTLTAQWSPVAYKIAFNANGGTGSMSQMDMIYGTPRELTGCTFHRDGYAFLGWATSATGAKAYDDKAQVSNLASTEGAVATLYAKWAPNHYFIDFDAAGGTGSMGRINCTYDLSCTLPANAFVMEGGTFRGWSVDGGTKVAYADRASVRNLSTVDNSTNVLTAVWEKNKYTVAFDGNGGEGSMAKLACEYSNVYTLPANAFSRSGYVFTGWTNLLSSAFYADRSSISNLTAESGAEIELSAVWRPVEYRLSFDEDGATGTAMASLDCTYDVAFNLPTCTYTRVGRSFSGWAYTPAGTVQFTDGQEVSNLTTEDNAEFTLYAVWAKSTNPLNIALDCDDLDISKDESVPEYVFAADDESAVNGSSVKINNQLNLGKGFHVHFNSAGVFKFSWRVVNEEPEAASWYVRIDDGATATNIVQISRKKDNGDSVSTTDWEEISITIPEEISDLHFKFNGYRNDGGAIYASFDNASWSTTSEEYSLRHWAEDPVRQDLTITTGGNAEWRLSEQYDASGTDSVTTMRGLADGSTSWVKAVTPAGAGILDFEWAVDSDNGQLEFYNGTKKAATVSGRGGSAADCVKVSVTNVTDGINEFVWRYVQEGTGAGEERAWLKGVHWTGLPSVRALFVKLEGEAPYCTNTVLNSFPYGELPVPSRNSVHDPRYDETYTFDGWYIGSIKVTAETIVTATSNHTLNAQWKTNRTEIVHKVTFNPCGGSGSATTASVRYGDVYPLPADPVRTGYDFTGWFTAASGGIQVKATDHYSLNADQALYAQWRVKTFKVTLDAKCGSLPATWTNPSEVAYGSTYGAGTSGALPVATKKDSTFLGWFNASGIKIASSTAFNLTADTVLYAHWQEIKPEPEPEPVPEVVYQLFESVTGGGVDLKKGATYNGYVEEADGSLVGSFALVVKKAARGGTVGAATMTVTDALTGKKVKVTGSVDLASGESFGDLQGLTVGRDGVKGEFTTGRYAGCVCEGAINATKAKDSGRLATLATYNSRVYTIAFTNDSTVTMTISAAVSTKGKIKFSAFLDNGTKFTVSSQMSVGDEAICAPMVYVKRDVRYSFVFWFDKGEIVDVSGLPVGWDALDAGSGTAFDDGEYEVLMDPESVRSVVPGVISGMKYEESFKSVKSKWTFAKATKVVYKNGVLDLGIDETRGKTNVSGMRLTLTKKTGVVRGSFTVYSVENGRLKKNKFTVGGVVIDDHGYGSAYQRKLGSFPIEIIRK